MISVKYALLIVADFAAGSFLTPPVQQAIAAVISTDVQCSGCVGAGDLASSAVTNSKIGSSAVSNSKIASNAVTNSKIADGTVGYADVSKGFIAQEHRDDCNCGGTGWDPDGTNKAEYIVDDRITQNSVVLVTPVDFYAVICETNTTIGGGRALVYCNVNIPQGMGINYAIIRNPAYG